MTCEICGKVLCAGDGQYHIPNAGDPCVACERCMERIDLLNGYAVGGDRKYKNVVAQLGYACDTHASMDKGVQAYLRDCLQKTAETYTAARKKRTLRLAVGTAAAVAVIAAGAVILTRALETDGDGGKRAASATAISVETVEASAPNTASAEPTEKAEIPNTPAPLPASLCPPVIRDLNLVEPGSPDELFEKGMRYLERNEYFNGLAIMGIAASEGNYSAQYRLFVTYSQGDGGMPQEDVVADYWNGVRKLQIDAPNDPAAAKGRVKVNEAQEYDRACIYFKDGEYPSAIAYLNILANEGDMHAQYLLAMCYMEGVTPERYAQFHVDRRVLYEAGVYWLQLAAKQGHCCAKGYLGYCYRRGRGVEQDLAQAFGYDRVAARDGCRFGLLHIGYFYADPKGDLGLVEPNYYIAQMFYDAAKEAGHAYASTRLTELEKIAEQKWLPLGDYEDELDVLSRKLQQDDPTALDRMKERAQGITLDSIIYGGMEPDV